MRIYRNFLKRVFDVTIALFGSVILFPFFILIYLVILYFIRENPLFFQSRPGKNGRIFKVIKFKTMNNKRDPQGNLLEDAVRLTPIGKLIRSTSLDEIPQLINVIKGDMSLIGPRPLLVEYLQFYNDIQRRRHEVKPGITGWAQVNGRNAISWEEKFNLDVWYVDHLSFVIDIKILWFTVIKVFKKEGINQQKNKTMEKFAGNNLSFVP
jgi:undecaprenyl phosphate N,N'-diacetylbacillosamine 1-phosphate transferase